MSTAYATPERRSFQSSELSRHSAPVFEAAEIAPVRVTRRDGTSLVLMSSDESDARDRLLQLASQLIAATLDTDRGSLGARLAERFDWMFAFSPEVQERCAQEIVKAARASFSTGQAHLAVVEIRSWQSTAEAISAGLDEVQVDWLATDLDVPRP